MSPFSTFGVLWLINPPDSQVSGYEANRPNTIHRSPWGTTRNPSPVPHLDRSGPVDLCQIDSSKTLCTLQILSYLILAWTSSIFIYIHICYSFSQGNRSNTLPTVQMADPLSITASVVAVITTAIQSTQSLYETVKRFKDRDRTLRRLQNELEDLTGILGSLSEATSAETSMFELLERPIVRCSELCGEFERSLEDFIKKSKTGIRNWRMMEFMGGGINEFIDVVAGYKSTISIGLGTLTLFVTSLVYFESHWHLSAGMPQMSPAKPFKTIMSWFKTRHIIFRSICNGLVINCHGWSTKRRTPRISASM